MMCFLCFWIWDALGRTLPAVRVFGVLQLAQVQLSQETAGGFLFLSGLFFCWGRAAL